MTELRRRVERLEHLATNAASVSADANDLANFPGNKNLVAGANITLTPGTGTLTIAGTGGGGGGQAAIQFEDEGTPLGAAGTVDTVDFVGAGVTAARVGDAVTVTIAGATVPTGTGFTHITAGVQDGAAKSVDLAAADVTGNLPYANLEPATAASRLLGRGSAGGAGDWQEVTLGTGLSLSGTVLNASGGGRVIGACFDARPSAVAAGDFQKVPVEFSGTVTGWRIVGNVPGTAVFGVTNNGASIVAAAPPTITSDDDFSSTTLTGWSTSLAAGDLLQISVTSSVLFGNVTLILEYS